MNFSEKPITIFTVPKAFEGHIGTIQRNAIHSWTLLQPKPQILLFGNEKGVEEACKTFDVTHVPQIQFNEYGTPLLDGIFRQAHELARGSILSYVNTDIILFNDFLQAVEQLQTASFNRFLMIGQRSDLDITEPLNFEMATWETELRNWVGKMGTLAPVICKDYFVFPKPLYADIRPFAVGRGHWDNWIVYHAYQLSIPVVDATDVVTVIHQNHGYAHLSGSRGMAYVKGVEAKQNAQLAGGMHVVAGSSATWKLKPSGVRRKLFPPLLSFLADMPRFTKLIIELYLPKFSWEKRASSYDVSEQNHRVTTKKM